MRFNVRLFSIFYKIQIVTESKDDPCQGYTERIEFLKDKIARAVKISSQYSYLRGGLFLVGMFFLIATWTGNLSFYPGLALTLLFGTAFAVIAFIHENAEQSLGIDRIRKRINQDQLAKIRRDWTALEDSDVAPLDHCAATALDLDLFGQTSIYQLLNVSNTPIGNRKLRDWICIPASPEEIVLRQKAAKELRDDQQLREDLQLYGRLLSSSKTGPDEMIEWAEGPVWLGKRKWLRTLAIVSSVIFFGIIFLTLFGIISKMVGGSIIIGMLFFHCAVTVFSGGPIHDTFLKATWRQQDVSNYLQLFQMAKRLSGNEKLTAEIKEQLLKGKESAAVQYGQLGRILFWANLRRSGLNLVIYLFLQFTILWDIHVMWSLEKWQGKCGHNVRKWFDALANWEALSSLAQLSHDHPDWTEPTVQKGPKTVFKSEILGHPLIANDQRVCNSVSLGPEGTFLLVTGSNMSGKSTVLRSVGLNSILAQAGAVVCAKRLSMSPYRIETSMRISDSLSGGVSFFMAELQRLKEIVDCARESEKNSEQGFLYLLDEILQGTNSRERHVAVSHVIEHLIGCGAIGAVSTHDLDLATADGLSKVCETVHFRENFVEDENGSRMTFDYVMRDGISTTTNALELLKIVGLRE